jgi:beta-lactamase class A
MSIPFPSFVFGGFIVESIMDILRRKKKSEENDDDIDGDELGGRKSIRDLKPKNRRNRKEPQKPWGKRERLTVLFVLILTMGSSGVLALSAREYKLPGLPRMQRPNINFSQYSFPFLGEKTIILEGKSGRKNVITDAYDMNAKTVEEFNKLTKGLSGVYGLYVYDLHDGSSYGLYETEVFQPASLNKLPVMASLYMMAEEGSLSLETKYQIRNSDKAGGSGSLSSKPEGYELTYRDLIRYMAKESDNTAVIIARRIVGDEGVSRAMDAFEMRDTVVLGNKQQTTPKDVGMFFKNLYEGDVLTASDSKELISYLTDTVYESHLSRGVPSGVDVAHKYGREAKIVNDAGIIFSGRPYVAVVLTKGVIEKEADIVFPELARVIYEGVAGK